MAIDQLDSQQPVATRKRPKLWLIALAAVLLAGIGTAGWLLLRTDKITITGRVEIGGDSFSMVSGSSCAGIDGFDDLRAGAQVVVTDDTGKTVGIGHLDRGSWLGAHCELPFTVDVPSGSGFYGVRVASRNVVQFEASRFTEPIVLSIS